MIIELGNIAMDVRTSDPIIVFNDYTGLYEIRLCEYVEDSDIGEIDFVSEPVSIIEFVSMEEALCFCKNLYDACRWQFMGNSVVKLSECE